MFQILPSIRFQSCMHACSSRGGISEGRLAYLRKPGLRYLFSRPPLTLLYCNYKSSKFWILQFERYPSCLHACSSRGGIPGGRSIGRLAYLRKPGLRHLFSRPPLILPYYNCKSRMLQILPFIWFLSCMHACSTRGGIL
jgi:hypothetical protein